jgi:hypothetical protein
MGKRNETPLVVRNATPLPSPEQVARVLAPDIARWLIKRAEEKAAASGSPEPKEAIA